MPHYIPKIEYNAIEIDFRYPPKEEIPEKMDSKQRISVSLAGIRQISVDYVEATRVLKFSHLNETEIAALQTFYLTHGYLGKTFKYFEDQNSINFVEYEMVNDFSPRRMAIATANQYFYEVQITMRRVTNLQGVGCMTADIDNNISVAQNITGLQLDLTMQEAYRIHAQIKRTTDSEKRLSMGWLTALYRSDVGWEITDAGTFEGSPHGVIFNITPGGQVQYVSDNMVGANYFGEIEFRTETVC